MSAHGRSQGAGLKLHHPELPASISVQAFDALHDDAPAWRAVLESIAAEHGAGPVLQMLGGTVLVALVGSTRVIKLYPPFLRGHCEFERAALARLQGRLSLPTPTLIAAGERDGWPYTVMSQLQGDVLLPLWPTLNEAARCTLLAALGALAAQVHALPVGELAALAPRWEDFIHLQRQRCQVRQQRTGLPEHLLSQLTSFLSGALPAGEDVILTGEYTPMNLLVQGETLAGMYDFGDGLVGPREYDWLGPLCFLAAGHPARCAAYMGGYGAALDDALRLQLMRLLLLHRYSHLPAQLALPGWQQATSFEQLTQWLWAG